MKQPRTHLRPVTIANFGSAMTERQVMNSARLAMARTTLCSMAAMLIVSVLAGTQTIGQEPPRTERINKLQEQVDKLNKELGALRTAESQEQAEKAESRNNAWMKGLNWRCIGPAAMGGRVTALAVYEKDPCIYYVATASGGLLKTVNAGNTFVHQFDKESTVSIGDVAVAASDPNIVWVGTGESNPRNSVSYGDGVHKSIDGGKTWSHMGLKESFQIGRIAIHPKDPKIVYVGALGRLYGSNEQRGLFKTTDGGESWEKVLYIDDKTGVIDVQMHPTDPNTLIVATYERERDAFDSHRGEPALKEGYDAYDPVKKWGPGSGLYKTTDGGKTFNKLTKGLPTCNLGRMNVDYYRSNPDVLFAIVESEKIAQGTPPPPRPYIGIFGEDAPGGAKLTRVTDTGPAKKAGLRPDDIVLKLDDQPVKNYRGFIDLIQKHAAGDRIKIEVDRSEKRSVIEVTLAPRPEAQRQRSGRAKTHPYWFAYGGQQANMQDKQGPNSHEYGGIYKSTDGGESWNRINSLNPRPMYFSQIRVDPSDEKFVYVCGISLHRSKDGGKTFTSDGSRQVHPDQHALWVNPKDGRHVIVGCDGGFYVTHDRMENWDHLNHLAIGQFYHVTVDTKKPYNVYGGLQDNGTWGGPSLGLRGSGPINEDWIAVAGGDGFVCRVDADDADLIYFESQDGSLRRRNLRTGEGGSIRPQRTQGNVAHRFNWNTPFILSSHNSKIYYCAGERVFRSVKMGGDLRAISPEITRTGRGSGTALSESPRNQDVLYVGSDDGALWVTRDGGASWTDIAKNVPLSGPRWVATLEASRFEEGRVYACFDGHRSNDDDPLVFVSEDFGQTWKSLRNNLPWGSTRCLREDVRNPNLLFVGTEFAAFASTDRGQSWIKLNTKLPTVAVHEIAIHPTEPEIVLATHGRSIWIADISPLRELTTEVVAADAHLYRPTPATRWRSEPRKGSIYGSGMRWYVGDNPPRGAQIYYSLGKKAKQSSLKIIDASGATIRQLRASTAPGLHRASWDMNRLVQQPTRGPAPRAPSASPPLAPTEPAKKPDNETPMAKPKKDDAKKADAKKADAKKDDAKKKTVRTTQLPRRQPPQGRARQQRRASPRPALPGDYRVVLTVDGKEFSHTIRLSFDPNVPSATVLATAAREAENSEGEEGGEEEVDP